MSATTHRGLILLLLLLQACPNDPKKPPSDIDLGRNDASSDLDPLLDASAGDAAQSKACTDPGCPCEEGTPPLSCAPVIYLPDGHRLCGQGTIYCRAGAWSECKSLTEYQFADRGPVSSVRSALISTPTTCDPCHPDCFVAVDKPVSSDLSATNSSNMQYDSSRGGVRPTLVVSAAQRGAINATAVCGNSVLENGINGGVEQCDDGNTISGDGCDSLCRLETSPNWFCPTAGQPCKVGVCGNGAKEGSEGCDDGNDIVGDGCGPDCKIEPSCAVGQACVSSCGDGIKLPGDANEECDDGNTVSGDGCSGTCKVESGFACSLTGGSLPSSFPLTVTYRDLIATPGTGYNRHPDFEYFNGSNATVGMVGNTLVNGKPSYTGICQQGRSNMPAACGGGGAAQAQSTSAANFAQWYANTEINRVMKKFVTTMSMNRQGSTSSYRNATFGQTLLPLNGLGWVATSPQAEVPIVVNGVSSNYAFTTEIHYWFKFQGGEVLTFSGDDDVWIFIAGNLALDIGGLHTRQSRTISINSLGVGSCYVGTSASGTSCGTVNLPLVVGNVYEMALFHAERHSTGSNFDLTLGGFVAGKSVCNSVCGDGIVTPNEFCDDGAALNGLAGYCLTDCSGRAAKYAANGSYSRNYTAVGTCRIPPQRPLWTTFNWSGDASTGGSMTVQLQGSETAAGLATAPVVSVPLSPLATSGSFDIRTTLSNAGYPGDPLYLKATMVMSSTLDQKNTPTLYSFDATMTCVNVE